MSLCILCVYTVGVVHLTVILVWRFGEFFFNRQTKITGNTITVEVSLTILGQSAKLNVHQFVLIVKSPILMSAKCTTPTVCMCM